MSKSPFYWFEANKRDFFLSDIFNFMKKKQTCEKAKISFQYKKSMQKMIFNRGKTLPKFWIGAFF